MTLDILFPVLNEHKRLENGIRTTMQYLQDEFYEKWPDTKVHLMILDNGSDDDTPQIGQNLADEFEEVEYVRIDERGVGIAFRTGVERSKADIIGYMDIDLSTDIRYLHKMMGIFTKHPEVDYVNASRFSRKSHTTGRKWYRQITSKGLLILLKTVLGLKSTDAICGFTFLRRSAATKLVRECYNDNGWFYMIEFLLRAERDGMKIVDMPVRWTENYDTTVNVGKTIRNYLKNILRLKKAFLAEERDS